MISIKLLTATALTAFVSLATPAPAAAQTVIGSDAAACAGGGPAIRANISGLRDRTGRLKLELYPANDADFLKDDRDLESEGKFFRRVWADTPASGAIAMCIRAPRPGRYALLVTHDRDGKNKFNFWRDGAGMPSNESLGRSRPALSQAVITVPAGVVTTNIRMQYMRGLGGFRPLGDD